MPTSDDTPAQRVAIIDDHVVLAEILSQAIQAVPGYEMVGWAADAESALTMCQRERPDIIVLDLVMPKVSGLTLFNELKAACPEARFMIFSGNLSQASVKAVLNAGVHAVVGKASPLEEFREALHAITAGQTYFGSQVRDMIKDIVTRSGSPNQGNHALTPRELTVLRGIAEGMSSKEMAEQLGVSVNTIVNHRSSVMKKTGLHRVAQLSLYAAQIGLVGEPR